jgi:hypothetical protein
MCRAGHDWQMWANGLANQSLRNIIRIINFDTNYSLGAITFDSLVFLQISLVLLQKVWGGKESFSRNKLVYRN